MSDIGKRVYKLRKLLKVSQKTLAYDVKVDRSLISKVETGGVLPSDELIKSICKEYDVYEKWLRYGEGPIADKPLIAERIRQLNIEIETINLDALIKKLGLVIFTTECSMGMFKEYKIEPKSDNPKIPEVKKRIEDVEKCLSKLQREIRSILKTDDIKKDKS